MATSKKNAAGPAGKGLEVSSRRALFWRAGLQFGPEPRVLPLAELSAEQAEAIRAEGDGGQLLVREVDLA
ncbi:MAG TPA: hypothetical protein PLF63_13400 [Rubrivivax sp.]|jgi:hypothetical protein|nr:hypothetical protein [Rubrivivax sp.]